MSRDQLQKMIALHESLLRRVKDTLDQRYYELEERGIEEYWLKEYIKQKNSGMASSTAARGLVAKMNLNLLTTMLTKKINLEEELADIQKQSAESIQVLKGYGFELNLSDWLTVSRYAKAYGVSQQVITNWISRGIIPADCVMEIPELNNIRLVKNQTYR